MVTWLPHGSVNFEMKLLLRQIMMLNFVLQTALIQLNYDLFKRRIQNSVFPKTTISHRTQGMLEQRPIGVGRSKHT
jgi:hypothetical protein